MSLKCWNFTALKCCWNAAEMLKWCWNHAEMLKCCWNTAEMLLKCWNVVEMLLKCWNVAELQTKCTRAEYSVEVHNERYLNDAPSKINKSFTIRLVAVKLTFLQSIKFWAKLVEAAEVDRTRSVHYLYIDFSFFIFMSDISPKLAVILSWYLLVPN